MSAIFDQNNYESNIEKLHELLRRDKPLLSAPPARACYAALADKLLYPISSFLSWFPDQSHLLHGI